MIKEKVRVYDLCVSRFPAYIILPKQYTTATIIMPAFITRRGRKAVTISLPVYKTTVLASFPERH